MTIVKKYMLRTLNSISKDATLKDVIDIMYRTEMPIMPVVNNNNEFLGTIYSKNILENIIPEQFGVVDTNRLLYEVNQAAENLKEIKERKVGEYMSIKTEAVKEMDKMDNVADIMLDNDESYLYVINKNNKLRGYISRADLLYYLLEVGEENYESNNN